MTEEREKYLTVGDLVDMLSQFPRNARVNFDVPLYTSQVFSADIKVIRFSNGDAFIGKVDNK